MLWDGKHIPIKCPKGDGLTFFKYKGFYSIVLLGLVDSDYKFIFIYVGCQGRISDGGVFRNTELYNRLVSDELNLPDPMELPESQNPAWNLTGGTGDVVSKRKIEIHFSLLMSISTNLISYEKQKV